MRKLLLLLFFAVPALAQNGTVTVTTSNTHQTMSPAGSFGAAAAFQSGNPWTAQQADWLYCSTPFTGSTCTQNGIGLSMLRVMIYEDGTFPFNNNIAQAKARNPNVKIWLAPWTAPAAYKSTNNLNTGYLCNGGANGLGSGDPGFCAGVNHYQDWASYLSNYVNSIQTNTGISVYALSVQNEPDFSNGAYRQMLWTAAQFDVFVRFYLGPTMATNNPGVKIMIPERSTWTSGAPALAATCQADPLCAQYIQIIAEHGYSQPAPAANTVLAGQESWQTEDSDLGTNDPSIGNGMSWATTFHNYLVGGNVNAWDWWWGVNEGDGTGQGLITASSAEHRMWALGNWSNFVKSGWQRIDVTCTVNCPGITVDGFKDPVSGSVSIVVINTSGNWTGNFTGFPASIPTVTPYTTSATLNLSAGTPITATGGAFTASTVANTVTTFFAQGTGGSGPVINSLPGWYLIPGTSMCSGPENVNKLTVPDNYPANLGSFTSYGFGYTSLCYAAYNDSNTSFVDTKRNRLIFWGGGHGNYWGNDFFEVNPANIGTANPVFVRLNDPAQANFCPSSQPSSVGPSFVISFNGIPGCKYDATLTGGVYLITQVEALPACSFTAGCKPTRPTPGSVHTYNNLVYVPTTDEMISFGGALTPRGNASPLTWRIPMSSLSDAPACLPTLTTQSCNDPIWTEQSGTPPPGNQTNYFQFDPNSGLLILVDTGNGSPTMWVFNPTNATIGNVPANSYASRGFVPSGAWGYHSYSVIDPYHKMMIVAGNDCSGTGCTGYNGIHTIDLSNVAAASTLTYATPAATGCAEVLNGNRGTNASYPGIVWDPISREVVIYPNGGNHLIIYNPTSSTCTTEVYGVGQLQFVCGNQLQSIVAGTCGSASYSATYSYALGDEVRSGGTFYKSKSAGNLGNTPPNATFWTQEATPTNSAPPDVNFTAGTTGAFGRFNYIPGYDIFLACTQYSEDCWYLRRRR